VVEMPGAGPVLDIKIANLTYDQSIVLAVTESSLYQFSGSCVLKSMLQECNKDQSQIIKN
jgi:hypothetical protein